jgi:hypothetical protein
MRTRLVLLLLSSTLAVVLLNTYQVPASGIINLRQVEQQQQLRGKIPPQRKGKTQTDSRWKVERLFSWLQKFRRIATRFDFHDENYLGFVHLGCIRILLRCYL